MTFTNGLFLLENWEEITKADDKKPTEPFGWYTEKKKMPIHSQCIVNHQKNMPKDANVVQGEGGLL